MLKGESIVCGALLASGELFLFNLWVIIFLVARMIVECRFRMVLRQGWAPLSSWLGCNHYRYGHVNFVWTKVLECFWHSAAIGMRIVAESF